MSNQPSITLVHARCQACGAAVVVRAECGVSAQTIAADPCQCCLGNAAQTASEEDEDATLRELASQYHSGML